MESTEYYLIIVLGFFSSLSENTNAYYRIYNVLGNLLYFLLLVATCQVTKFLHYPLFPPYDLEQILINRFELSLQAFRFLRQIIHAVLHTIHALLHTVHTVLHTIQTALHIVKAAI